MRNGIIDMLSRLKIFGCTAETDLSAEDSKSDSQKPQRRKGSEYTLRNRTISSIDPVNYRYMD